MTRNGLPPPLFFFRLTFTFRRAELRGNQKKGMNITKGTNITAEMINIMQVILIVFFSFLRQNIAQQLPFSGQVFQ